MAYNLRLTAFCLAFAVPTFCQDASMLQADAAFSQALVASDKPALETLLDRLVTWTTAAGKVLSKSDVVRGVSPLAISNPKAAETKAYTYGNLGNVQVNSGRAHLLRVWVKRSDGWKVIVYQELMSRESLT